MEKRKAGITFNFDKSFQYMEYNIPEEELFKLADTVNKTQLFKMGLAQMWLNRQRAAQVAATQRNTTS